MNNLASALTGINGERVALSDVSVSAVLNDLLSEVTVCQAYRNDERVSIEAVYTFPLPLDAVLLDLKVEIGGRVLEGIVVERKEAEESYEDAVASGDAAVMLEVVEPGLYTMNVGNLLPQEEATITFRYAILYRWAGDRLRFFLPTMVAPRFGESPHLPHQAPESSLVVENQFSLRLEITGSLREAQFVCPSHEVTLKRSADKVVIALQQAKAVMDRDFVLNVKALQSTRSFVLCGPDGDGLAVVASFQPFFPGLQQPRPLNLAIVIDCSGSMEGDSIQQAKQALEGILDALEPQDQVTLIAFGSTTSVLSNRLLVCNRTNLGKARRFAKQLDANMGGTEIGLALRAAYAVVGQSESADIFLVTDGEVSSWEEVAQEAKRSGHRIFTVGVGSSVSEAFVRGLAADTGGECELVSPREGMAGRVVRHFERMRGVRATRVAVRWPEGARDVAPTRLGRVFEGDTVIAYARFAEPTLSGAVVLEVETEEGEVGRQELQIALKPPVASTDRLSTVARLAASARLLEVDAGAGLETALRYRLVSRWTNWLVIAPRPEDEKVHELPVIRKVPQTLAAGWGGTGTVNASMSAAPPMFCRNVSSGQGRLSAFMSALSPKAVPQLAPDVRPEFHKLLKLIEESPSRLEPRRAMELLREAGLASELDEVFRHAADLGLNVEAVAAIVLADLLSGILAERLPPAAQRDLGALQQYAKAATEMIRELTGHGTALLRVSEAAVGRDLLLLRPGPSGDVLRTLEQFARLRDLGDHLQAFARHAMSR